MPYFGGKMKLAEWIVSLMPKHGHYVEPFGGSLAVLLAKPPSPCETVNDLDQDLMTFWRVLRERPADLERACALTPHARAEHQAAYEPAVDDLERARRVWVHLTQGRAGLRRATGWRTYVDPSGTTMGMPFYLRGYVRRIPEAAERLIGVSLECRSALDVIDAYGRSADVLLYVDPPYLGSTRSSGSYVHEMATNDEHRQLADALHGCRASVLLSGYPSPLYADLYADWRYVVRATATGQGGAWAHRTEVVWTNRPAEITLMDLIATDGVRTP